MKQLIVPFVCLFVIVLLSSGIRSVDVNTEWTEYLGGPDRNHYSTLTEINPSNVSQLKIAWEYHTMDSGQLQCNPIV